MAEQNYNATVVEKTDITHGLRIIKIEPDQKPFNFVPGQYTVLGLKHSAHKIEESLTSHQQEPTTEPIDKMIQRAYSIASSSNVTNTVEFYLALVSTGQLTPRLFHLEPNDRLYMSTRAAGLFTLDRVPQDKHVILISTGTGLAPYISMLRSKFECGGSRKFVVIQGARYSRDLGYLDELQSMAKKCSNLVYFPSISRPKEDTAWQGLSGYVQTILFSGIVEEKTGLELNPNNFHIFVCGNPGMIDAAKEKLTSLGYTPDHGKTSGSLHIEEYW